MSLSYYFPTFARILRQGVTPAWWRAVFSRLSPRRWLTWRLARRCLVVLSCVATAVALAYQVENWRGRRAWERVEKEASAHGLYMSWAAMPVVGVPEAENVFAAPVMRDLVLPEGERDGSSRGFTRRVERWSLRAAQSGAYRPTISDDLAAWRKYTGKEDLLRAFDEYAVDMAAITRACERPSAAIPMGRLFSGLSYGDFFEMNHLFVFRARVYLEAGKPSEAAGDIRTVLRAVRRMNDAPGGILLSGLVGDALVGDACEVVAKGLRARSWEAKTLAEFDEEFAGLDLLRNYPKVFAGEFTLAMTAISAAADGRDLLAEMSPGGSRWSPWWLCPRGWILQNGATYYREWAHMTPGTIDLAARRIDLARFEAMDRQIPKYKGRPYEFIVGRCFSNMSQVMGDVAAHLTRIDLTRVACRLEQHRLEHGEYPASLADLARPPERDGLHDLLTGEPFRYVHKAGQDRYTLSSGDPTSAKHVVFE